MFHHLTKHRPEQNLHRYYLINVQQDLFGQWTLQRTWGRIGQRGQSRQQSFPTQTAAVAAGRHWLQQKERRGYQTDHHHTRS